MNKFLLILAAFLVLSGCAASRAKEEFFECLARESEKFDRKSTIEQRMPANLDDATLDQLSSNDKASDEEIAEYKKRIDLIRICRKGFLNFLTASPSIFLVTKSYWDKQDFLTVSLIQRKMTWGEYLSAYKSAEMEWSKAFIATVSGASSTQFTIDKPLQKNCETIGNKVTCSIY